MNEEAIRIVIADDHPIFRYGLRKLLEIERGFSVVGEADKGGETISLVRELKPTILLLDLRMGSPSGLQILGELATLSIPVQTIILAAEIETAEAVKAIQLGARRVLLKESATEALADYIREVAAGNFCIGKEKVSDLMGALHRLSAPATAGLARKRFGLTLRELEIIEAVLEGCTNKDMAQKFSVSEHTVKHHLTNIFDKLGVSNRLELVLFAAEHQLTNAQ